MYPKGAALLVFERLSSLEERRPVDLEFVELDTGSPRSQLRALAAPHPRKSPGSLDQSNAADAGEIRQEARAYVREAEASAVVLDVQHESTRTTAPTDIAARLGIADGDPVMLTRYDIRMGNPPQPVTMSVSWEPLAITGGTDIEPPHEGPLADRGIVAWFDHIGLHVNEVEEIPHIRNATAEETRRLELLTNRPVVEITQFFRVVGPDVDDNIAVETADIVFAADCYELRYALEIKQPPTARGILVDSPIVSHAVMKYGGSPFSLWSTVAAGGAGSVADCTGPARSSINRGPRRRGKPGETEFLFKESSNDPPVSAYANGALASARAKTLPIRTRTALHVQFAFAAVNKISMFAAKTHPG